MPSSALILVILVELFFFGSTTSDEDLASFSSIPAAFWTMNVSSGGAPSIGVRTAIYADASAPDAFNASILWAVGASATQELMLQYRVSTASGSLPVPSLFEDDAAAGCQYVLLPDNNSFVNFAPSAVNASNVRWYAGGLLTCDWGIYSATDINAANQPKITSFNVFYPNVFDAVPYFDIIAWVRTPSEMVKYPLPDSSYVLWVPMVDNTSSVANAISANNTYNTSEFVLSSKEVTWLFADDNTKYAVAAVTPLNASMPGYLSHNAVPLYASTSQDLSSISRSSCFVADVTTYVVELHHPGDSINGSFMGLDFPVFLESSQQWQSASALMQDCDADQWCAGFFTVMNEMGAEVGNTFLRARPVDLAATPDAGAAYPRLVHWKRAIGALDGAIACPVAIAENMDMTVRVASANVEVAILVDGLLVGTCTPDPEACGTMATCATLRLLAGSMVSVVVSRVNTVDPLCRRTVLYTLFEGHPIYTLSNDTIVETDSIAAHNASVAASTAKISGVTALITTPLHRKVVVDPTISTFYTYVYNVSSVWFVMQQNAFGANVSSPAVTFTVVASGATASYNTTTCGGSSGFRNGNGWSDRCDLFGICPSDAVNVSAALPGPTTYDFSGFVRVDINWTVIGAGFTGKWRCNYPDDSAADAAVYVLGSTSMGIAGTYGWPGVLSQGDKSVYPMHLVPHAASVVPSNLHPIQANLTYANVAEMVPSSTFGMYAPISTYAYVGDEVLACVIDIVSDDFVSCVFPIPLTAAYVTLTMEDSNLETNPIPWFMEYGDGSPSRFGICGGAYGFPTGSPANGQCGSYRTCVVSLTSIIPRSADPFYARLILQIPKRVMRSVPCPPFAFRAVANYSTTAPEASTSPCDGYYCKSSGTCISMNAVCDGSVACPDGSDERNCFHWYQVERNATLNMQLLVNASDATLPSGFTISSMEHCRALAMRNGSQAVAYDATLRHCLVYNFTAPTGRYDFATSRVSTSGFDVYAVLSTPLQYATCSDRLSCSNNGRVGKLSSGACACVCSEIYTGSSCTTFQDISTDYSEVFLLFPAPVNSTAAAAITESAVTTALKRWIPTGSFTCKPLLRVDSLQMSIVCNDGSKTLNATIINNASALVNFNVNFAKVGPSGLTATAIAPTSIPKFESVDSCSLVGGSNFSCELPGPVYVDSLAVSSSPSLASTEGDLYVSVTFQSSSRRIGNRVLSVKCPESALTKTVGRSNRVVHSCLLDIVSINNDADPLIAYNLIILDINGDPISLTSNGAGASTTAFRRLLQVPLLFTPPNPATVEENFTIYQWAAIALLGFGLCLLGLVTSLAYIHRKQLRRVLKSTTNNNTITTLHKVVAKLFIQMTQVEALDSSDDDGEVRDADGNLVQSRDRFSDTTLKKARKSSMCPKVNKKQYSFMCASVWICAWLVAVFLMLYFITSSGVTSDTWVVVERYADNQCQNSSLSPTPQAAFYITDNTAMECSRRHVAGKINTNFYFAGWCIKNATGTNVIAKYRSGPSKRECEAAALTEITSDSCTDSASLWGVSGDVTYTRIVCGSIGTTTNRFGYLLTMSTQTDPTVSSTVVQVPSSQNAVTLQSNGQYRTSGFRKAGSFVSYAVQAGKFETSAVGSSRLPVSGQQFLFQREDEMFLETKAPFYSPKTTSMEETYQGIISGLVSVPTIPSALSIPLPPAILPELPIGQLYGNFNKSNAVSGASAGPTATKYYGVHRSLADIGAYIDTSTMEEGQGFTISFNLRATAATYGFAFAVTDAFEDQVLSSSPILDLLMNILQRNAGVAYWFTEDYHIYHSFFVDGPAKQLSFVYAYPTTVLGKTVVSPTANVTVGKTLGILTWHLDDLSLQRVLNGLWHQIRVVLRMETNLVKVQLIVDGETSRSTVGWNQCLNDELRTVRSFPQGADIKIYNKSQQTGTGAMLWAGYFNGGIGDLTYLPYVEDQFDIWKGSSDAIKNYNRINELGYLLLGYIMCGFGAVCIVYLLLTSGKALYLSGKRADSAVVQSMFMRYMNLMAAMPPVDDCMYYAILKYTTAKRWLNLSDGQLGQFLDELQQSTPDVSKELIRVLYLAGDALRTKTPKDTAAPMPSTSDWATLIHEDEAQYIEDNTRHFPCYRAGVAEADPYNVPVEQLRKKEPLSSTLGSSRNGFSTDTPKRGYDNDGQSPTGSGRDEGAQVQAVQQMMVASQRGQANMGQKGHVGEVNTGNLTFKSGGGGHNQLSMKSDGFNGKMDMDIKQLFFPIVGVMQSVYLWISSSRFVTEYLAYFGELFAFVSIDFVVAFQLPTLVTPLVQLLAGLLAFLLLLYLTAMDEIRFSWYVARYVLKRDQSEHVVTDLSGTVTKTTNYCGSIIETFKDPFGKWIQFPKQYDVEVLPVQEAMKIDRFVGISDVEESTTEADEDLLTVKDAAGREFHITRGEHAKKFKELEQVKHLEVETDAKGTTTTPIEVVGVFCREHRERRLSPQIQTDVWPFLYAPACCVVVNGVRCDTSQGIVYSCHHREPSEDGSMCVCDYAVCERHYRGGLVDGILADGLAATRTAQQRGTQWVLATAIMLGANAAYMPFVKTAIMILACHPAYQCEFTECHNFSNQKYLIAFYLAMCVAVLFGFGLPLLQVLQLRRRRGLLFHIFFADEYNGRYDERDDAKHDEKNIWEKLQRSAGGGSESQSLEASVRAASRSRRREGSPSASRRGMRREESRPAQDLDGTTPTRGPEDLFGGSMSGLQLPRPQLEASPSVVSLENGRNALDGITRDVLRELKAYSTPPPMVKRVLEAVAILLGAPDASSWDTILGYLSQADFVAQLKALSPTTISRDALTRVRAMMDDATFTQKTADRASRAAGCLFKWLSSQVSFAGTVTSDRAAEASTPTDQQPAEHHPAPPLAAQPDLPEMVPTEGSFAVREVVGPIFTNADYPPVAIDFVRAGSPVNIPAAAADDQRSNASSIDHLEALDKDAIDKNDGKVLQINEWNRFLASDPTVLGTLYKSLAFNWIFLSPIILLWKVVLICPAVFLPFETFEQLVGISITEVGFALFIFGTAPFTSPIVDVMYRVGSIHQLVFLGLRSLDTLERFQGNEGYGLGLVLLTLAYLGFSALCIVWTVVGPQLRKAWDKGQSTAALEELGYQYTLTTSLYVVPAADGVRCTEREDDAHVEDGVVA